MSLRPWSLLGKQPLLTTRIFRVMEERWRSPRTQVEGAYAVVDSPDWVNVVALDRQGGMVLIRQFRFGTGQFTLEVPGGMVDPGEAPSVAAERELREETGYRAGRLVDLGYIEPNPAIFNNRAHMFLAQDCEREGDLCLDPGEDIEVLVEPVEQALTRWQRGEISHALVSVALSRFVLWRQGLLDLSSSTRRNAAMLGENP